MCVSRSQGCVGVEEADCFAAAAAAANTTTGKTVGATCREQFPSTFKCRRDVVSSVIFGQSKKKPQHTHTHTQHTHAERPLHGARLRPRLLLSIVRRMLCSRLEAHRHAHASHVFSLEAPSAVAPGATPGISVRCGSGRHLSLHPNEE